MVHDTYAQEYHKVTAIAIRPKLRRNDRHQATHPNGFQPNPPSPAGASVSETSRLDFILGAKT